MISTRRSDFLRGCQSCTRRTRLLTLLICIFQGTVAGADDWPQWRGPRRDAICNEQDLLQNWPDGGPPLAWSATTLGTGYSSVIVGRGVVYTMGRRQSDVIVTALDAATGHLRWSQKISETSRNPSSTPTLDGELLFVLDPDGDLVCLKAATGDEVWKVSFLDQFGGKMMSGRGYGESPLIDGERLICTPGGPDAALVALNKFTGKVIWKAALPELGAVGRDGAGFSSIVISNAAKVKQYVQLVGRGLIGVDAQDGRFLWGYNELANSTANIPTPVVHQDYVFAANGYTAGSVLLDLVASGETAEKRQQVKAEVVYSLTASQFQNHHGGMVRVGEYLYAGHGNNNGLPTCLELATGKIVWKRRGPGTGSAAVIYADNRLYFRYQNGVVALIEATDRGYQLHGTLEIPGAGGDSWAHPAISNGLLYLREQETLLVYNIQDSDAPKTTGTLVAAAPVDMEVISKLRTSGVSVERLNASPLPSTFSARRSGERSYEYARQGEVTSGNNVDNTELWLISPTAAHFTKQGEMLTEIQEQLKKVNGRMVLSLAGIQISDQGLAGLCDLPIVGLNLELCTQISDLGLVEVSKLPFLRELILTGTSITQIGIKHLIGSKQLVALDLELCDGITDSACESLGKMSQLKSLQLKKSGFEKQAISNAGMMQLKALSQLESLNLYGNKISDAGLAEVTGLTRLKSLNLSLLAISDTGLTHQIGRAHV